MRSYKGLAASPGVAIGPMLVYHPEEHLVVERKGPVDPAIERALAESALVTAAEQLRRIYEKALDEIGEEGSAIFLAHEEFLSDPAVQEGLREQFKEFGKTADRALGAVFEDYARQLEQLEDEYYRERASDVRDVSRRLQRILAGVQDQQTLMHLESPVVVVAKDLTPSDTAQMNKKMVIGFCTAVGGLTSHTAIIARILGIPAIVGMGEEILGLSTGTMCVVDGDAGELVVDPAPAVRSQYELRQAAMATELTAEKVAAQGPAVTVDGRHLEIVANIADAASAEVALEFGAEGVGLFRTEYLFLNSTRIPDEAVQYRDYRAVADVMGKKPLIIRTLDIGGDKQLPYLDIGEEQNPFLGWRAIRLCLDNPELFQPQLRAIVRSGVDRNVLIMFPMVATREEVRRARAALETAMDDLRAQGTAVPDGIQVGIMVEIPSAALMADVLASEVDFFSIGSNDLIQYTMACDRVNEKVAYLYDPLHPAVLRLIDQVIRAADAHNKWVGMCGEMAGDLESIPILVGLGLYEFSMNAPSIPKAKALIRSLSYADMKIVAQEALTKGSADEVRDLLRQNGLFAAR